MKLIDLMTKKPVMIEENASILDAVRRMQQFGCGILPVGSIEQVVGVLTDRDIMIRAVAQGLNLKNTPLKNIMSKDVTFCQEDDSLQQVINTMHCSNKRRVLVRNKNHVLTGLISLGDIIRRIRHKELLETLFKEM